MQIGYIFSEAGIGFRRNISMTIALIVTIFVSLSLAGVGLLLTKQTQLAEKDWGNRLQITFYLCGQDSLDKNCANGAVTAPQRAAIEQVIKNHPDVAKYEYRTSQQEYDAFSKLKDASNENNRELYKGVTPQNMPSAFWVTLKDPKKYLSIEEAVQGLDGVNQVRDMREVLSPIYSAISWLKLAAFGTAAALFLAAVLQVANTIRLAAMARRREIGIMKLVGASNWSIQIPFVFETLLTGLIGAALASGLLAVGQWLVVENQLRSGWQIVEWVSWPHALQVIGWIWIAGVLLTVIPTLLLTRKYLKV